MQGRRLKDVGKYAGVYIHAKSLNLNIAIILKSVTIRLPSVDVVTSEG